jgi:hypothetical protein
MEWLDKRFAEYQRSIEHRELIDPERTPDLQRASEGHC